MKCLLASGVSGGQRKDKARLLIVVSAWTFPQCLSNVDWMMQRASSGP